MKSEGNSTVGERMLRFLNSLEPDFAVPPGVQIMHPFRENQAMELVRQFYRKFYNNDRKRFLVFGINPGRFGGGITGIPFTDPVKLEDKCGIPNPFLKKNELSADFIYRMIDQFGGPEDFFASFLITAVCPLGFTRDGKNMNYYDDRNLALAAEPFISDCLSRQVKELPVYHSCFCLGEGANYRYLSTLNDRLGYFTEVIPLPHPRWVMQYRRKQVRHYIELYLQRFHSAMAAAGLPVKQP
jgi:hypothetical protein